MFIILFIFNFILLSVIGGIIYLIYLPIKNRLIRNKILSKEKSKLINGIYIATIFLITIYITYIDIYPSESFYRDEFKMVTLREVPASAKFISTSSTYPDFHGDYSSNSEIKLSSEDYNALFEVLYNDKRISKPGENKFPEEENYFNHDYYTNDSIQFYFIRQVKDEPDRNLVIKFNKDGHTVYINVTFS